MRWFVTFVTISLLSLTLLSCAGASRSQEIPSLRGVADTSDECRYMDELCREARTFQQEFDRMAPEQQKSVREALNSYIKQCNESVQGCRETLQ